MFLGHQQHFISISALLEYDEWVHKSCMLGKEHTHTTPSPSWVPGLTLAGAATTTKDFPYDSPLLWCGISLPAKVKNK